MNGRQPFTNLHQHFNFLGSAMRSISIFINKTKRKDGNKILFKMSNLRELPSKERNICQVVQNQEEKEFEQCNPQALFSTQLLLS